MTTIFSLLTRSLGLVGLVAVSLVAAFAAYAAAIWAILPKGAFSLLPDDGFAVAKAVVVGLVGGGVAFFGLLREGDGLPRDSDFDAVGLAGALGDLADTLDD